MHVYSPIYTVLPYTIVNTGPVFGESPEEYTVLGNKDKIALFKYDESKIPFGWKTIEKLSLASPTDELFFGVVKEDADGKLFLLKSTGQKFKAPWITNQGGKDYAPANELRIVPKLNTNQKLHEVEGLRLEFVNAEIMYERGYNQNIKFYPVGKPCVDKCSDPCSVTHTNVHFYLGLIPNLQLDVDELLVIEKLVVGTTTVPTVNGIVPYEAAMTALKNAASGDDATMVLKLNSAKMYHYGKVNLKYAYPRQTTVVATMAQSCKEVSLYTNAQEDIPATIAGAIIPKFAYEQGNGYDMKQVEYEAAHWNGLQGAPMGTFYFTEHGYKYQVDETKKYHQYIINRGNVTHSSNYTYMDAMTDIFLLANDAPNANGFTHASPGTQATAFLNMLK